MNARDILGMAVAAETMMPVKENRQAIRMKQRKSNNRKGNGLVVAKIGALSFVKYRVVKQFINGKLIIHSKQI